MRRLEPMSEFKRYLYGAVGIIPGIIVSRITGFHIFTGALYAHHDALWIAWAIAFAVGGLMTIVVPMWYWVARPVFSGGASTPPAEEVGEVTQ